MSMSLTFNEHSYYFGHAIMRPNTPYGCDGEVSPADMWQSIYYDGVKGRFIEREAPTLKGLKSQIKAYEHNYYQNRSK